MNELVFEPNEQHHAKLYENMVEQGYSPFEPRIKLEKSKPRHDEISMRGRSSYSLAIP